MGLHPGHDVCVVTPLVALLLRREAFTATRLICVYFDDMLQEVIQGP